MKYISLVNLVADKEVVRELVADTMTVDNVRSELEALLYNKVYRNKMLEEYDRIIQIFRSGRSFGGSGTQDGGLTEEINFSRCFFVFRVNNLNPGNMKYSFSSMLGAVLFLAEYSPFQLVAMTKVIPIVQ